MQTKLIIAGVGVASAAVGAVVSWAITADHFEHQLKIADGVIERYEDKIYRLEREVTRLHGIHAGDVWVKIDSNETFVLKETENPSNASDKTQMIQSFAGPESLAGAEIHEQIKKTLTSSEKIAQMKAEAEATNPEKFADKVEEAISDGETTDYTKAFTVAEELKQEEEAGPSEEWEQEIVVEETPEETRNNLQRLIQQYTDNEDDVNAFAEFASKSFEDDYTPPFVISDSKYRNDPDEGDEYAKIELTYFPNARLLLDDDEDPIEDVNSTVGWRNLKQFGGDSGDPDTVFIRNRRMLTDFEVVRSEDPIPLHIKYGMGKEEFKVNRASGLLRLRPEDE